MTKVTAQARHKQSREAALEEMSLQTSAKSRQRGCGCYVLWQTAPHMCSGDRKSSVAAWSDVDHLLSDQTLSYRKWWQQRCKDHSVCKASGWLHIQRKLLASLSYWHTLDYCLPSTSEPGIKYH